MEPDDVLAIYMMFKGVDKSIPTLVVSGEGNRNKTGMITSMLNYMGCSNFKVIQGNYNKDKDYPETAVSLFGDAKVSDDVDVKGEIESFLTKYDSPLILGIKPFTELVDVKQELLSKAVMAMYGGFNLRCMFHLGKETLAKFVSRSFKRVILYESFHVGGEQNSINKDNARELFQLILNSTDPILIGLINLINLWNDHIAEDCLKTAEEISKAMLSEWQNKQWPDLKKKFNQMYNRNLKVVNSILFAENMQMVLADFGLTALLLSKRVKHGGTIVGDIVFDDYGYTSVDIGSSGNVFLIKSVGFDTMVSLVTECMKD